jgi:rhomboid protease GluP
VRGPPAPEPRDAHPRTEEPLLITPSMLVAPARRGAVDFERGMSLAPRLTLALIAVNVVAFIDELATGALRDRASIVAAGALVRTGVYSGQVWRLVSSMFLHGGVDHLIGNMIVLYIVGMACEHALGALRTAVVYFAAGISGGAVSLLAGPGPGVGASGAIFGLAASVIVILYRYRSHYHLRDKRIGLVLTAWAVYQVLSGLATPYIDNFAHLGGIAGGAATTFIFTPRLLRDRAELVD